MKYETKLSADIRALIAPMSEIVELKNDCDVPGLYMLIGSEGKNLTPAYVGISSSSVARRVYNHNHDLWEKVVIFYMPDYHSIPVSLRPLEHFMITLVEFGDRYFSLNKRMSGELINDATKRAMEDIFDFMQTIGMDLLNAKITRSSLHYDIHKLHELTNSWKNNTLCYGTARLSYTMTDQKKILARKGSICSDIYSEYNKRLATEIHADKRMRALDTKIIQQNKNRYILAKDMLFSSLADAMELLTLDQFDDDNSWESFIWGASRNGSLPDKNFKARTRDFMYQLVPDLQHYIEKKTSHYYSGFHKLNELEQRVIISRYVK